jgi:hypothetical protein
LRVDPGNRRAHHLVAASMVPKKQYAEAEIHIRAAMAADGGNESEHYVLGEICRKTNRRDLAIREFETVLRMNANSSDRETIEKKLTELRRSPKE